MEKKEKKKEARKVEGEERKEKTEKGLGDLLKKVASVGANSFLMSEESIRNILGELPLSKDIISSVVQNAKGAKEDFTKGLRDEFRKYLFRLDKENLIDYILQNYTLELKTSLNFKKKESKDSKNSKDS